MSEDLIEIVYALGQQNRVIAQIAVADFPQAANVEQIITSKPGIEGIAALKPTAVIGSHFKFSQPIIEALGPLGIEGSFIDSRFPAPQKIRLTGAALGVPERGEQLASTIEAQYSALPAAPAKANRLRVIHFSARGAGDTGKITGSGADTPANTLIELAGGLNVGAEAGLDRYQSVTPEGVITMAPQAIIVSGAELESLGGIDGIWERVPGLNLTPAAQTRNIIVMRDQHIRQNAAASGMAAIALAEAFQKLKS